MTVWRLLTQEVLHRKLNFGLGVLAVMAAVGCLVGAITLLRGDEIITEQTLAVKQHAVEQAGAELEDAMRKITIGLGFNVLVLPADQDLNELHVEGSLSKTMPEEFVHRLASSKDVITVNHLLPIVTRKIRWEEQDMTVVLIGTRGEVPFAHRDPKKPMLAAVPEGKMVVGHQVQQQRGLKVGDTVTLMGKQFEINQCYPERGTVDDSSIWIGLSAAQDLLGMQNLINGIWALECHCAAGQIAKVRAEVAKHLPGTKVIERGAKALARTEARTKAKEAAEASLEQETANRQAIRQQRESFAAVLVPIVFVGSGVLIGFLTFVNARQRRAEIGILRAIGLRSKQILMLFLGKALIVGLLGAIDGYLLGLLVGIVCGELPLTAESFRQLFLPELVIVAFVLAPLLSAMASWLPAMAAAQQDPASILHFE